MTNGIIDSGQEIVTNGLVLHLDAAQIRSYSGTGTNWRDLISGVNATLTNGAVFNSSNGGNVSFDGVDDYVDTNRDIQFGATSSFSLESYFYLNSYVNSQLINNESGGYNGYQLSVIDAQQNTIFFSLRVAPGNNIGINFVINSPVQKWTHVLLTYNGSGVASGVNLYADGVLITGVVVSDNLSGTINSGTTTRLGRRVPPSYGFLNGKIGLTRIYNRELSATEVLQNYNATKARFEVPALLDLYPNAAAAYSLRKLRSGYTGSAIRVRRSSDNTEQDIGFTSTGDLDTTALTTFVGANNGFVTTWYDQSGNNRNATQTTQANQPIVVSGGTLLNINSKPSISFDGINDNFAVSIPSPSVLGGGSEYSVLSRSSSSNNLTTFSNGSSSTLYNFRIATTVGWLSRFSTNFINHGNYSFINQMLISINRKDTSTEMRYNSTLLTNLIHGSLNALQYNTFGFAASDYSLANFQEVIFYPSNQSPNRIGIETNINSYYGIYNPTVVTMDTDAQAFITAAGITDLVQQGAINTLVKTLKDFNLWLKMKAIYPFVGGTAASHKFNLKDPRDVDGAFRLVFSGGWTHSSSGATPNGTTGYADTRLNPNTVLQLNAVHLSVYNRSNLRLSGIIGSSDVSLTNALYLYPRYTDDKEFTRMFSSSGPGSQSLNAQGFWVSSRVSSTGWKVFRNNFLQSSYTITSSNKTSFNTYIGAGNLNGTPEYGVGEFAFATIGDGLTDTEAADLYSAVQTFQTTLGRQV